MRALLRHPDNMRFHDMVELEYMHGVLKMGVLSGVRGVCWAVCSSEKRCSPYLLLTYGKDQFASASRYQSVTRNV